MSEPALADIYTRDHRDDLRDGLLRGYERHMTAIQLRAELSQRCEMAGGQSEWARRHGIASSVVSEVLHGRRDPSAAVINAMGFMRVERFIPIKRGSNA
jgi:hypothetical protein